MIQKTGNPTTIVRSYFKCDFRDNWIINGPILYNIVQRNKRDTLCYLQTFLLSDAIEVVTCIEELQCLLNYNQMKSATIQYYNSNA